MGVNVNAVDDYLDSRGGNNDIIAMVVSLIGVRAHVSGTK